MSRSNLLQRRSLPVKGWAAVDLSALSGLSIDTRVFARLRLSSSSVAPERRKTMAAGSGERRWSRLLRDIFQHVIAHRRVLPMSTILSYGKKIAEPYQPGFPPWLDDEFASRTDARAAGRRSDQLPIRPIPSVQPHFVVWYRYGRTCSSRGIPATPKLLLSFVTLS